MNFFERCQQVVQFVLLPQLLLAVAVLALVARLGVRFAEHTRRVSPTPVFRLV